MKRATGLYLVYVFLFCLDVLFVVSKARVESFWLCLKSVVVRNQPAKRNLAGRLYRASQLSSAEVLEAGLGVEVYIVCPIPMTVFNPFKLPLKTKSIPIIRL